jgi:hypothetical protein
MSFWFDKLPSTGELFILKKGHNKKQPGKGQENWSSLYQKMILECPSFFNTALDLFDNTYF